MKNEIKSEPKSFEVLAPMHIKLYSDSEKILEEDWAVFREWVERLKHIGVDSVSVNIFWGMVAKVNLDSGQIEYQWEYYDQLISILKDYSVQCTPIFSFNLETNTELTYVQQLPDWIWTKCISPKSSIKTIADLKYVSETGEHSFECLSLWSDDMVFPYYMEFMKSFRDRFMSDDNVIRKVIIGMGPVAELRYPSYNFHDWGAYPNRGTLQCYSKVALSSMRNFMISKYGDLSSIGAAWLMPIEKETDINLPNRDWNIFEEKRYIHTQYGRDILEWYNKELIIHGKKMLDLGFKVFSGPKSKNLPIAFKIPLVYWKMDDHAMPRVAEVTTGLVKPHENLGPENQGEYQWFLEELTAGLPKDRLQMYITGAEITGENQVVSSNIDNLSKWISTAAHELGIKTFAENSKYEGLYHHQGWDKLERSLGQHFDYQGFSIKGARHLLINNELGIKRFQKIVENHKTGFKYIPDKKPVFRIMGPLHVKVHNEKQILEEMEWFEFDQSLKTLKNIGVSAISIDVWWGLVLEENLQSYNWDYYIKMVEIIKANGLNWVPILSFHQAGGNINDDYLQLIPLWLWGKLMKDHPELESVSDLQYVSETGDKSIEYISLWADEFVVPYYEHFMHAFRDRFAAYANMTDEINVSLGPAGELRYPSFNLHDWGSFPNRGTLQCYSNLAQKHFKNHVQAKYGSIDMLNKSWKTKLSSFEEIRFPQNPENFFTKRKYLTSNIGLDISKWYHKSLVDHGKLLLGKTLEIFSGNVFENIPIGFKVPGIHWNISNPDTPRTSELTAGLIAAHHNLNATDQGEYKQLLNEVVLPEWRDRVVLHFTCLEKHNKDYEGYSRAQDLVDWIADDAHELGIDVMGENATTYELDTSEGWDQIERALTRQNPYSGLTILRMKNLLDGHEYGLNRFKELIEKMR